jgi:endo-1,4-beta-xylanase
MKTNIFTLCMVIVLIMASSCFGQVNEPALKDVFKKYFTIGAALNGNVVSGKDPKSAAIVEKHFNTVTPENAMKWVVIHPEPNRFDFEAADRLVAFGQKKNMFIIGHTLVWQNQIPRWAFMDDSGKLLSRDAMLARMKDHIFTIVGRYKGKVNGWDVVNEAFTDEGAMQKSGWLDTIGEDFVLKAFEYAHEADPGAELYYNEYSCEKPAKRDAISRLVRQLKSKGLRIDGVGIQGHWGMDYPVREEFDAFVDSMAAVGMKVMVTELDVDILPRAFQYQGADVTRSADLQKELNPYADGLPDDMQKKLSDRYAELFTMMLTHPKEISRVTFWGVYDKTSWLNNWPVRGRTSYPLLFDRNYEPKPAFEAVIKTVKAEK